MRNSFSYMVSAIVIVLGLASCAKESPASPEPTMVITSPQASQTFAAGATLHITGTATASGTDDAHLLHELSLVVKRPDGTQLWRGDLLVHEEYSHAIDTSFVLPQPSVKDSFILEATVVNHLLKTASQKVGFTVNP